MGLTRKVSTALGMVLVYAICLSLLLSTQIARADTTTHTQNGYTVIVTNNDPSFPATLKQNMINTFFSTYPQMAARFHPNAARTVNFKIDPNYTGVAATGGSSITYGASYMKSRPSDIDVVTHEGMHVVQAYPNGTDGWLTEGLADYARYKYGVNNAAAGWSLGNYSSGQHYTNSYRITARFLLWLELRGRPTLLVDLNNARRTNTYTRNTWVTLTGQTVDQLWTSYTQDPSLPSGPAPTATRTRTNTAIGGATATRTRTRTNTAIGGATATRTRTRTNTTSSGTTTWAPNTYYAVGATVSYAGVNYRCQQAHTSQLGWEPPNVPALWLRL